jgi:hypothetical protein
MPAVLDITPITLPSAPEVRRESARVGGDWARTIWASSPGPIAYVAEPSSYEVGEQAGRWTLERGEGGYTASDTATSIYGSGATPNDAIVDLVHALREHRELLEDQIGLSPELQRQLAYLRQQR